MFDQALTSSTEISHDATEFDRRAFVAQTSSSKSIKMLLIVSVKTSIYQWEVNIYKFLVKTLLFYCFMLSLIDFDQWK